MLDNTTLTPVPADVSALQAENEKLKSRAQNLEAENVNYKKQYSWITDPESARAKLEDYENMKKDATGGDKVKIDKLIEEAKIEVKGLFSNKLGEYEKENGTLKTELKTLRVTNVAMQEAAKYFNADGLPLLQKEIESTTDFIDGKVVILENGKPRISLKDPRNAMEMAEYMEVLAKMYPSLAKSQSVAGGQLPGQQISAVGEKMTPQEFAKMDRQSRAAYLQSIKIQRNRQILLILYQV